MKISKTEIKRMESINASMDTIGDLSNEIYEALADMQYEDCHISIKKLIRVLKNISSSIKNEAI